MGNQLKIRSILKEQIPGAPDWVDRLLQPLNEVILAVGTGFNNGLTFSENVATQIKILTLTTAAQWHEIGAQGETVTFENSWENYASTTDATAAYRKQDGIIFVKGNVKSGAGDTTVFTLPLGYRPPLLMRFAGTNDSGFQSILVRPTGAVVVDGGSPARVSLNFSFHASDPSQPVESPFPITFQSTLKSRATGCVILGAAPTTQPINATTTSFTGPFGVDAYDTGKGQIIVKHIQGLLPATSYNVLLLLTTR